MESKDTVPVTTGTRQAAAPRELDPFTALQRRIDQEFESFGRWFRWPRFERFDFAPLADVTPRMNVSRQNGTVHVEVELPGMEQKDVQVNLEDNVLTVTGERKSEKEEKGKETYRREFSYGSFSRSVELPAEVLADKARATFKNGVLTVDLPVNPATQAKTHKIPVQTA
ncbi:MAG TPA: Hsp20/alpha crystallin family protein [bacterium]|nr:Hsp20/alpha crystallin family protein [bacterium]